MDLSNAVVIQALNGLSIGAILVLVALGLAIIFGLMGVINLAHGEFFMLGAYTVVGVYALVPNFWVGLAVAPLAVGTLGLLVETTLIRRLYNRPLDTLLATWGLSIVFRQLVRLIMGPGHFNIANPIIGNVSFLGINYPIFRLFIIGVTVLVVALMAWFWLRTDLGLQCRAVITNRRMASAVGIDQRRISRLVFAAGAAAAGLAGAIMSPYVTINPEMGLDFLARSFLVVTLGGIGTLFGVLGGGVVIGGLEGLVSYHTPPVVAQITVLLLAVIMLRFRPRGLFGR